MASARKKLAQAPSWPPSDEVFDRVVAEVKAMTPAQFRQSLVDAGILTKKGNYTKPYRMLGKSVSRAPPRRRRPLSPLNRIVSTSAPAASAGVFCAFSCFL